MSTRLFSQSWENGLRAGFGKIEMDKGGSLCLKQGFFLASNDVSDKPKRIHHCKTPSTSSNSSLGSSEEDDETASTASTDPSDVEDYADSKPFPSFENQTDESPFPPSPHQPLPHVRLPIPSVINPTSNHLSLKDLAVRPPPPVHSSPLEDTAQFPVHQFEPFVLQSDIDRRLQRLQTASPTGALPLKKLAMMNSHRQVLEDREGQIVKEITRLRSEMQNLLSGQANWAILKKAEWITKRMEYLFWLKDNVPAMKTEFNQMFLKTEATFANSEWNKWEMKKVEISKMRDGAIKKKRNIEVLAEGF